MDALCSCTDLLVFSHLRWDFVYQRPQHLMTRFAKFRKVYFIEEPLYGQSDIPRLHIRESSEGVHIVVPHFPHPLETSQQNDFLAQFMDELITEEVFGHYSLWYYTPMALPFSRHLSPKSVVYDCMDELSLFKDCPPALIELEKELFKRADVVFTGGQSLYEAKQEKHHNIHAAPSSIDFEHFSTARFTVETPKDQKLIPYPRLGFFGVIDERMDIDLLARIADLKPEWQLVMIGPVVKIDPASLPQRKNIHYLGKKSYQELPAYLAGWDCAMMPFALNDSTRFISPTKTPEYLAAGKPVVSTAITDVVNPYGINNLVHIAHNAEEFVAKAEIAMREAANKNWQWKVSNFLESMSWDNTWSRMAELENKASLATASLRKSQAVSDSLGVH